MTDAKPAEREFSIYLSETAGHVIGMTMPLQPNIAKRWGNGELRRVNADGTPWAGDGYIPPQPAGDDTGKPPGLPSRPAKNASVKAWREYAMKVGMLEEADVEQMTRDELIDCMTPNEEQPPEV